MYLNKLPFLLLVCVQVDAGFLPDFVKCFFRSEGQFINQSINQL